MYRPSETSLGWLHALAGRAERASSRAGHRPDRPRLRPARATFNGMIERRPELIARPLDVADVLTALRFAREADLPWPCAEEATASRAIA